MLSKSRIALLFVILNTPLTCLAMLQKKTSHSLTIGEAGGVQSLCTATNGTSEICIIGHAFNESFSIGALTAADQITKSLLRPILDLWSTSDHPITLLNFDTENTCARHELINSKPPQEVNFHLPLQAALNAFASQTGFKHQNLRFVCTPPLGIFEEYQWDPGFIFCHEIFPGLAEKAGFTHRDVGRTNQELATSNHVVRKRFFQKNNPFEAFVKAVQETYIIHPTELTKPVLTIPLYLELLTFAIKRTKKYAKQLKAEPLKNKAQALATHLELTQQHAESYFRAYGIPQEATLAEALLDVIKKKQTISESINEFSRELLDALFEFRDFASHALLVAQAQTYQRIVLIYSYDKVYDLLRALKESGYEISYKGQAPKIDSNTVVALCKSPFAPTEITRYLRSRFGLSGSQEIAPPAEGTALMSFERPKEKPPTLGTHLSEMVHLVLASQETSTEKPVQEFSCTHEEITTLQCTVCSMLFKRSFHQPGEATICSSQCLVKNEIGQKCPKLAELLQKKKLSQTDKLVKKQLSSICYLWFLALSPMIRFPESPFSKLSLTIVLALEHIEKNSRKEISWTLTLEYAQLLGIDITLLNSFLTIYIKAKERYNREIVQFATQRHKQGMDKSFAPVFDTEDVINRAQQELYRNMRTFFAGTEHSSGLSFAQFYYALAKRLSPQLITTDQELEEILTLVLTHPQEKKKDTLDEALSYINKK